MEVRRIESWGELLQRFEENGPTDVLFRGVGNDSYELIPKIGRENSLKTDWSVNAEKHMLTRFQSLALPHLDHQPNDGADSDWLVIGQHYGLPTRLLDWTENPLAATFFAVEWRGEEHEEKDVAVYMERLPTSVTTFVRNIFDIEEVVFLYPPHIAKRVTAQNGCFTVYPNPTTPYDSDTLIKWVIPSDMRQQIQVSLDSFGVNRASLFPDLDGVAATLDWRFRFLLRNHGDG